MSTYNSNISRSDGSAEKDGALEGDRARQTSDCLRAENQLDSGVNMSFYEEFNSITNTSVDHIPVSEATCSPALPQSSSIAYESVTDEGMESCKSGLSNLHLSEPVTTVPHFTVEQEPQQLSFELYQELYSQDEDGDTKLHLAVIKPDNTAAKWMVAATAPCQPSPLNFQNDRFRQTPLHLAVLTNQPDVVRLLFLCGAMNDIRDHNGNTPLHLACSRGLLDCIKALTTPVSVNEKIEFEEYCQTVGLPIYRPSCFYAPDLACLDYEGRSYFHLVQSLPLKNRIEITAYLVNCGADINIQDGKGGQSVLHLAVKQHDTEFVSHLCRCCRNVLDIDLLNYNRMTALDMASFLKYTDLVQLLTCHGASQSESFSMGGTEEVTSSDEDSDDAMDEYDDLVFGGQRLCIH